MPRSSSSFGEFLVPVCSILSMFLPALSTPGGIGMRTRSGVSLEVVMCRLR